MALYDWFSVHSQLRYWPCGPVNAQASDGISPSERRHDQLTDDPKTDLRS